jgi:hypothetical protein
MMAWTKPGGSSVCFIVGVWIIITTTTTIIIIPCSWMQKRKNV